MPRRASKSRMVLPRQRPAGSGALIVDTVARDLIAAIASQGLPSGTLLPTERELAARHRVARMTIRGALKKMAGAGVIECCPRVGYKVVDCRPEFARSRPVGLIRQEVSPARAPSKTIGLIEGLLAEAGRAFLVGSSHLRAEEENDCIRRFKAAGVGGLIVTPATSGDRSLELENWIGAGMPTVLEGHPGRWLLPDALAERCDQVDSDNCGAIRTALEYLAELGHERIAYITSEGPKGSQRIAAFKEVMSLRGGYRPEWVLTGLEDARAGGAAALGALLAASPEQRPTAVLSSGSDELPLGLMAAARSRGIRCPQDLSVISFGDCRLVPDPEGLAELTTLEFSAEEITLTTLGFLSERLAGDQCAPRQVLSPVKLMKRNSCARAPQGTAAGKT